MNCPKCGKNLERLGQHWSMSCSYPKINSRRRLILSGLLMGDGHIPESKDGETQMRIRLINDEFLSWLDDELSWLSCGVRFVKSAEESAKSMRDSEFRPDANSDDYSDVYEMNTRTHPYFTALRESWYTPDKRFTKQIIPDNKLTYKMWYVTDGGMCKRENRNPYPYFRMDSNRNFAKVISRRLSNKGIESNVRDGGNVVAVSTNSTDDFLDFIGEPPAGFEYKW